MEKHKDDWVDSDVLMCLRKAVAQPWTYLKCYNVTKTFDIGWLTRRKRNRIEKIQARSNDPTIHSLDETKSKKGDSQIHSNKKEHTRNQSRGLEFISKINEDIIASRQSSIEFLQLIQLRRIDPWEPKIPRTSWDAKRER